ncbi:MAG: glycosyltransferase family 2 protein [Thermoguttaceae bacterium]|jgi:glycosyltransferase involved in cell wall biosynthesis|nr:glycosyltransferase family 2 protein [Thermoguttaceae bacterium]
MISVLILTKNEELNIARCLESVRWADDVVVLDDHSTDRTVEIARRLGARVIVHSAGNERQQRTYSLRQIQFRHPWVYNPDADELTPDDLRDEMLAVVADTSRPEVAYRVRFKNLFLGKWIKHSSLYPTWVMRLFRPEKIRFERATNLTYLADGPVGRLESHFLHDSFHRGMRAWLEKHVRYAHYEAVENLKHLAEGRLDWRGLVSWTDPVRRRAALKQLSFRLPCRPLLRFVYMYFLRRGFLDGRAGYTYCRLLALYEQMIVFQRDDLVRRGQTAELESPAEVAMRRAA